MDAVAADPQQPGRQVLSYKQDLAVVLADMGQLAAASDLQAEVLREAVAAGIEERFLLRGRANLAAMLAALGRLEEAEREQRKLVGMAPPVLGAGHPDVLEYQAQLARFLTEQGKVDEALALLLEGMAAAETSSSVDQAGADRRVAYLRRDLAAALVRTGRLDEARDHLQRSVTVLARRDDHSSDATLAAWSLLVVLHRIGRRGRGHRHPGPVPRLAPRPGARPAHGRPEAGPYRAGLVRRGDSRLIRGRTPGRVVRRWAAGVAAAGGRRGAGPTESSQAKSSWWWRTMAA